MYREDLIEYLEGIKSSEELESVLYQEIASFKKALKIKGGSAEIIYNGDIGKINISEKHLQIICNDYLNGKLNEYTISYIIDALTISENSIFESEELREKFEYLTDFEVNGHLTKDFVISLLG